MIKRLALCVAISGACLLAGADGIHDPRIQAALVQIHSGQWTDRAAGFYSMARAGLSADRRSEFPVADGVSAISRADAESRLVLVQALNALLDLESNLVNSGKAPIGDESYSDYYGDVIQAVTVLRDTTSAPVLLKCINTGGMAVGTLASLGDEALSAAMNLLVSTADAETRHSLFRMFAEMAEPRNLSRLTAPDSRSKLLNVLLDGARDGDPYSRLGTTPGLARFTTPEAVQTLRRLAESDPFTSPEESAPRYLVREAASKALKMAASQNK